MAYTTSAAGIEFIKGFESFEAKAYKDVAGVWTIGYGSTRIDGKPVVSGQVITLAAAVAALKQDVGVIERAIERLVTPALTQNQVDALVDFCYNLGVGAFTKSSLRTAINAGRLIDASLFTRWNKAKNPKTGQLETFAGLTRRRAAEFALYTRR